jgi:predicted GIY-YIG superfamily endonuclease
MQQRFWPDPQPLVERLGRDFFRNLPERPGVYLMRGAGEAVLYVGKAKNLRKRLGSYRVANPERVPRRHLRLLRAVMRIELQECDDERAALASEAELLRTLKPRFNRAGTWPGKPRFLAWKTNDDAIKFAITESPQADWHHCGPMGAGAFPLCALLARLFWLAMNRARGVDKLPEGWAAGRTIPPVIVRGIGGDSSALLEVRVRLESLFAGEVDNFCQWIENRRSPIGTSFERAWLDAEFESLRDWFKPSRNRATQAGA